MERFHGCKPVGLHRNIMVCLNLLFLLFGTAGFVCAGGPFSDVSGIECAELRKLMTGKNKPVLVDVRSQADYELSHIAGAVSVPFNKLPAAAKWPKKTLLVLYCSGKGCPLSDSSALALIKEGYKDVKVLQGGMAEWELKEYPVVRKTENLKIPPSPPLSKGGDGKTKGGNGKSKRGIEESKGGIMILDSRAEIEFAAGHPKGAVNIPLEKIEQGAGNLPAGAEIIICDRSAERSGRAVSILNKAGFSARAFSGGIAAWSAKGYEMEAGKN